MPQGPDREQEEGGKYATSPFLCQESSTAVTVTGIGLTTLKGRALEVPPCCCGDPSHAARSLDIFLFPAERLVNHMVRHAGIMVELHRIRRAALCE